MNIGNLIARPAWLAASACALAVSGPLQAQTLDFGSCVRVEDLSARLACYDRAAGRGASGAAPAAPAAPVVAPAPRMAAPSAPVPAPEPAPARAADPVAQFGSESVPSRQNDALTTAKMQQREEAAALPKQIEARVASVRQRPGGEQVLTLENGQVWQQTEPRREPVFAAGDTVIIKRGMLGSFLLTLSKGSPTTRVKRIS